MLSGVTVLDPPNTYIEKMVELWGKIRSSIPTASFKGRRKIGEHCIIEHNSRISDSTIGNRVTICSNSIISESKVENQASIGPFAHLRSLSEVKSKAKIGNFVEVKKSIIGSGSNANHLSYIGDSFLGEDVNIGAGTITCNYDGFEKHQTIIGNRVFVGSNVELVAPVKVGSGVLRSVPAQRSQKIFQKGRWPISRVKQKNIKGWSKKMELHRKKTKSKKG